MNIIPKGTTHVWAPAVDTPQVGGVLRWVTRSAYYRRSHGKWRRWSSVTQSWNWSGNPKEWFDTERKEGYFVTINRFNDPNFKSKVEVV